MASESESKRVSLAISDTNPPQEFEQGSGRATRARTRLVVEGLSNIAIFAAGIQAQLLSVTNTEDAGPVAIATNAAFFGGLIFSAFTAVLATLSARWFSILREDDADYLSSRWLAQDSKREDDNLLKDYLDYQLRSLGKIRDQAESNNRRNSRVVVIQFDREVVQVQSDEPQAQSREPQTQSTGTQQRGYDVENGMHQQSQVESIADPVSRPRKGSESPPEMPKSTHREKILSYVLLSPLMVGIPSFALFTTGILLLAWDKQHLAVVDSISTVTLGLRTKGHSRFMRSGNCLSLPVRDVFDFTQCETMNQTEIPKPRQRLRRPTMNPEGANSAERLYPGGCCVEIFNYLRLAIACACAK
ncbi:hypothetical protein AG1IA_04589 [Rhizoctonia solani AG-1 IA]|uniref:Uncharacterized protein n=1 Tax=Thanatephorus cucumeris (strain AG1-IA) TaxID=983506 RepID=L8WTD7_THACA|nr:hypothetical protein AG1IA_04589 [Rhizoctonia solani AG-1 IA]